MKKRAKQANPEQLSLLEGDIVISVNQKILACKAQLFKRQTGKIYRRITPVKTLLRSTTLYEILKRGDICAVCLDTWEMTVVKGNELVEPLEANIHFKKVTKHNERF